MSRRRRWAARGFASAALACALLVQIAPNAAADVQPASFSFGASGDFGYSSNAQATMSAAGGAGLDFFIAMGDTTYSDASESTWCSAFRVAVPNVLIQAGNHDTGEDAGANLNNLLSACPYGLNETLSGRYGREWFFDYPASAPLARFILSGCGTTFAVDSESKWTCARNDSHYNFVAGAIDGARTAQIPWVIVATHKNCISKATKSCEIGTDFFDLLLEKRVDLILQGHDHYYGRSKQLACASPNTYNASCVVNDGASGVFEKGTGPVLVINGMGGRPPYSINESDAEAAYFGHSFNSTFGLSKFIVNQTAIAAEFVRGAGGTDSDSWRIEAPENVTPPPPPPPGRSPPPWIPGLPGPGAAMAAVALGTAAVLLARRRQLVRERTGGHSQ